MKLIHLLIVCALGNHCLAPMAVHGEEISGELVGLPVSLSHEKQLLVFDQLIAASQWDNALELLDRLPVGPSNALVRVSPGRYVHVGAAIQKRLTTLLPEGRVLVQQRQRVSAASHLSRARLEQDPDAFWRIMEEYAVTAEAAMATDELASRAARQGHLDLALRLWRRLNSTQGLSNERAPAAIYTIPVSDVELARSTRKKLTILLDSLETQKGSSTTEFGLDAPGAAAWTALSTANTPLELHQKPIDVTTTVGQTVIVNDGELIRAIREQDGEPRWPSEDPGDVGILIDDRHEAAEPQVGVPYRQAAGIVRLDHYYGVLGDMPRWNPRHDLIPPQGALVALDIGMGEGRTVWKVESRELPETEWQFHGRPVLVPGRSSADDLVIVPICRPGAQVELGVAAFRQDGGECSWWCRIGVNAGEAGQPIPETQILAEAGLVIARTQTGVIVAIDPDRGRIDWASTSMVSSPPETTTSSTILLAAQRGVLVVGDPLSAQVAALSLDGGEELWRVELPDTVSGVVCGPKGIVLVTGRRLWALSLETGVVQWQQGGDDPAASGTGAPCVIQDVVAWPTRQGVLGIELHSGELLFARRLFSGPVSRPMSLQVTATRWYLTHPESVFSLSRGTPTAPGSH